MGKLSIPIEWPEDADALRELERQALHAAATIVEWPPEADEQRLPDGRPLSAVVAHEIVRHWPPGPGRPPEVTRLVERYGEAAG